ncbi:hypothetical protein [Flavobacterium sp.]|uniref:hypothetical protein n=1 Tax=Flavobacterium sp. TaxID=239 RepID=UPI0024885FD7|nr:hypothetical protein [Flavobacterium sp.]MDI1316745.1 hypothetical protein [Flavobacterium sp.]
MKKISLLLAITFLLQSCYSYKKVNINPKTMVIGQTYKIVRNNKTTKAVYTQNADSVIFVLKNGYEERIPIKNITSAKEKKFSLVKTVLLVPVTLIAISGLFILTY